MIPKIIHYCWFGRGVMPELAQKCIASWHRYLPEYEYRLWNEDTFDVSSVSYVREAYEARKFAFVTDYVRLWALEKFGGVYMDTDVQIFKNIDRFLYDEAFTCFENATMIPTALMACAKGNDWMKALLEDYEERFFIDVHGNMDFTTNVTAITNRSLKMGFVPNAQEQVFGPGVHIYTKDYFCPIDTYSNNDCFTDNTYAAHLYNGSWTSPTRRFLSKIKKRLGLDLDKLLPSIIVKLIRKI